MFWHDRADDDAIMPSEQEIAGTCVAFKVRSASRAVSRHYDHAFRPVDLRVTQFTVLNLLALGRTMTMAALANRLAMDRTTLVRNLVPLERRGLVLLNGEGRPNPTTISLSAAGRTKLEEAIPLWEKAQASLRSGIGEACFEKTLAALDELIRIDQSS
jgi:DNA-binding MarR family transcriptional regulator